MSEIEKNEKLNTGNIFDEFEVDEKTKKDISKLELWSKKDLFYYIIKIWIVFKILNFMLFFVVFSLFSYIFIQKSTSDFLEDKQYLWPFCSILNWDVVSWDSCSSLAVSIKNLEKKTHELQSTYLKSIISILQKTYEINNVKNSKESIFIIYKNTNKSDPYEMINEFDKIKNEFTSIDKKKIQCDKIKIKSNIFEAKCSAFSTLWYDNIPWPNWDKVNTIQWTSISLAGSFVNFISKKSNIRLLEKQKTFSSSPYFGEWNYTYKTDFKIKFEYGSNDLSL